MAQRVRQHRHVTIRIVDDRPIQAARRTHGPHHPTGLVVAVAVLGAVTIHPADHPPGGVVAEAQRPTRGVHHLGKPATPVIAIADDLDVGLPRPPPQPDRCDQPLPGVHHQPVPTRMGDLGERPVVGVVTQLDPMAVTISDRGERQGHLPGTSSRHRKVENMPGCRVGHRIGTGGVTGQRQPWALRRPHGRTGYGVGVGEQHPVRRGVAHALVVDLQAVVQRRTPRRAEPAPGPIRRHVGPLQRPGE